jgi:hypothetical protein
MIMTGNINPNGNAPTMKVAYCDANNPANISREQFDNAVAVTKSDATVYDPPLDQLYVGGTGAVTVVTVGGQTVAFAAVPAGTWLKIRCTKVKSTGTDATSIVGVW